MAELIYPALRVRIARRRYAMAGRKDLRNFDWDKGIWLPPPPRASRFGSRPFVARAVAALCAAAALGLGLANLDGVSRAADGLSRMMSEQLGSGARLCDPGDMPLV